jgi:hypothetical protein
MEVIPYLHNSVFIVSLLYVNVIIITANGLLVRYVSICVGHLQVIVKCKEVLGYCSYKALVSGSCHVSTKNKHNLTSTAPAVLVTAMFAVWVCITSKLFRYPH